MKLEKTVRAISTEKDALENLRTFFLEVAHEVLREDRDGILMHPIIELEDGHFIIWSLVRTVDAGEDWDEDEETPPGLQCCVGLFIWVDEEKRGVLSIFVAVYGDNPSKRWRIIKEIIDDTGGSFCFIDDTWSEDEIEIERIRLESDKACNIPYLVERIIKTAQAVNLALKILA